MSHQEAYTHIYKKVRNAHLRHLSLIFIVALLQSWFYAGLAAGLAAGALSLTPWGAWREEAALGLLAFSLPAAIILFTLRAQRLETTALLADRHLRLKEKISSALELGREELASEKDREWQRALLNDALRAAQRMDVKKAFPWVSPPEFKWLWLPAMILLLTVFVLPQWDLLTGQGQAQANDMMAEKIEKDLANMMQRQLAFERRAQEEKNQQAAQLAKDIKELSEQLKKNKIDQREALAQMASLDNKWQQRKEQLQDSVPNLKNSISEAKTKMGQQLEQAMKEGNFAKAAEAMQSIQKQLKTDSLDDETRQKLAQELKKLSENLSGDLPMSKALSHASDFMNAEDLDETLKNLQMAELDAEALQDLMQQMALLDQAMNELDTSKAKMLGLCPLCKSGQCSGANGGQCKLAGSGSGKGQATAPFKEGENRQFNNGMGGPGIGRGGQAQFADGEVEFQNDRIRGQMNEGPFLGMLEANGPANRGESQIDPASVLMQARQAAEEALTEEHIPATRRSQVRSYFNSLNEQSE